VWHIPPGTPCICLCACVCKFIEEEVNYKSHGIQTDKRLHWKNHTDPMSPKLSVARYMVGQIYRICNNDILRSIYFDHFHSIASYGIILQGNSSYSRKIFTVQKRIVRIMVGAYPRTSCRKLL